MDSDLSIILIVVAASGLVIAVVLYFALRAERKRREMMLDEANRLGARFEAKPELCMEGGGEHFVVYEPDIRLKADQIPGMFEIARKILAEFRTVGDSP